MVERSSLERERALKSLLWSPVDRRRFLKGLGLSGLGAGAILSACAAPAPQPAAPETKAAPPAAAPAGAAKPVQLTPVRLSMNNPVLSVSIAFYWIGEQLGYYATEGLTVSAQGANGATESTNFLATGQVEFGPPAPSAVLQSAAKGRDLGLLFVYALTRSPIYFMSVKPDSPIKELKDLIGKKMGVPNLGDEGVTFTKAVIREIGGNPDKDVQIIATGARVQSGQALEKGEVDAIVMPDGQTADIVNAGIKLRYLPNPKFYSKVFGNYIATRRELAEKNPKLVAGYLRGLTKSIVFFETNPEAAIRIHWKMIPESKPKAIPEDQAIKEALLGIQYRIPRILGYGKENMPRGQETAEDWDAFLDYNGMKGEIPDVSKFYTNDFIKEANNFDAAAIVAQAKAWKQ